MESKENKICFVNPLKISKYFFCVICKDLLKNPTRIKCANTFCEKCIDDWIKLKKHCPICNVKFKGKHGGSKDLMANKLIRQLEVKCLNVGCLWIGTIEELEIHLKNCTSFEQNCPEWLLNLWREKGTDDLDCSTKSISTKDAKVTNINDQNLLQRMYAKNPTKIAQLIKKDSNKAKKSSCSNQDFLNEIFSLLDKENDGKI